MKKAQIKEKILDANKNLMMAVIMEDKVEIKIQQQLMNSLVDMYIKFRE